MPNYCQVVAVNFHYFSFPFLQIVVLLVQPSITVKNMEALKMASRFELSQAVQKRLKELNLNADEVIRKAIGMTADGYTTSDGTYFPEGTVFISWYKDKACSAMVKNGALRIDDKTFSSLSSAAAHYTGRPTTNGWGFWNVKLPGQSTFVLADTMKKSDKSNAA